MRIYQKLLMLMLAIMLIAAFPNTAIAAMDALHIPIKSALEKIKISADSTIKSKLNLLYLDLLTSQEQVQAWDEKIKTIHYKNEEDFILLLQQIKRIDIEKLDRLKAELKKTKDRYKP